MADWSRRDVLKTGIVAPAAQATPESPFYQATQCYYWLHVHVHVHAQDGVIHIESPAGHTYTLGQFFDLWRQPLSANQVGPAKGKLTTYVGCTAAILGTFDWAPTWTSRSTWARPWSAPIGELGGDLAVTNGSEGGAE